MSISMIDPFNAVADPALPSLKRALDPVEMSRHCRRVLTPLFGAPVRLRHAQVIRHKPGRRCLIEYDLKIERPTEEMGKVTLLGKVRARRSGAADLQALRRVWYAGFQANCADGISVPEPIALLPRCRLWLQRKVPGKPATELLACSNGPALCRRIAEAAHKLHRSGVTSERRHTLKDELRILRDCLQATAREQPALLGRLDRLFHGCEKLAAAMPTPTPCGIHRDFYADQVIATRDRLYLIDFDLFCMGDPALDIGNFLGHIIEQSLRTLGEPRALTECEQAMEERFVELSGERGRPAVQGYATLTLARHVYLSTRFEERRPLTAAILELCEERLAVVAQPGS